MSAEDLTSVLGDPLQARQIVEALDAGQKGFVTRDEFVSGYTAFVTGMIQDGGSMGGKPRTISPPPKVRGTRQFTGSQCRVTGN